MNTENAVKTLLEAMKGFHGRFKQTYGQVAMRIDDYTYLASGNQLLSEIVENDLVVYDISDNDLSDIFNRRDDINAFIFGCSQDTVAASEELDTLQVALEDMAQLAGPEVQVAKDKNPRTIMAALKRCDVCYVKGFGAVSIGATVDDAVAAFQILHKSTEAYLHGKLLGGQKPLDSNTATWLKEMYADNYVATNEAAHVAYVGFDEDRFKLRSDILDYGRKMIHDDLAYGVAGNLSVRAGADEMLISPSSMDYFLMAVEDTVRVNINTLDYTQYGEQRVPSTDFETHAAMYRTLPSCNAIIHTHSNAISVFAACEAGFAMTDPQLKQLIGDIKIVPYIPEDPEQQLDAMLATLQDTHAAILPHHGAIFYGPSIEVVYEIAKAVEMMARNILGYNNKTEDSGQAEQEQ